MGARVIRWVDGWLGEWVGAVSYMGECCCCCYLELSVCHCRVIADPHHTRQERGSLKAIFEQGYLVYHMYISAGDRVRPPNKGYYAPGALGALGE